jgi:hypothetical protein
VSGFLIDENVLLDVFAQKARRRCCFAVIGLDPAHYEQIS